MPIRAVLFDVGGPLDTEVLHEQGIDDGIIRAFAQHGVTVSRSDLDRASDAAVASFAPNAYAAMAWQLSHCDLPLFERVWTEFRRHDAARASYRGGIELREGIPELLRELNNRGIKLGLAANQPARIIAALDSHGIGQLFAHREVSEHHGYRKPDVRLFLRACDDLAVKPEECVMVGDRIDNDIAPARLLGMRTVLFRTGRHIRQQPRSPDEIPDAQVHDVAGLKVAIEALLRSS
jgi:HAD superfamily hydrolase (TIGR01662 family)